MTRTIRLQSDGPWPHRLAWALACAAFPLIWLGGTVTTYDAGMAVPDWPSTYGYNLFLYPWGTWLFGPRDLFLEHGHRLLGAFVGMLTIALVVSIFLGDRRRWMRVLSLVALAAVTLQGCLGGARVIWDERRLAMLHGCFAPAFFVLCVSMAVFTSRLWRTASPATPRRDAGKLHKIALLMTLLAYVQVVLGAQLRHMPIDAAHGAFRAVVFSHLILAGVVTAHALTLIWIVWFRHYELAALRRPASILALLAAGQLPLGGGAYVVTYFWPNWLSSFRVAASYTIVSTGWLQTVTTTTHAATGSLLLALALLVSLRSFRLLSLPYYPTRTAPL